MKITDIFINSIVIGGEKFNTHDFNFREFLSYIVNNASDTEINLLRQAINTTFVKDLENAKRQDLDKLFKEYNKIYQGVSI